MEKFSSCRGIGITLSVAIVCLGISVVIAVAAHDRKCGTYRGMDCHENRLVCDEDLPCYCSDREYDPLVLNYEAYCKTRDWELTGAARVFADIFGILFLGGIIASIVQCIMAPCNRGRTMAPTTEVVSVKLLH